MSNTQIVIIFVDIDYTIFDDDVMRLDYDSIEALKIAQKNGVLVYLNSARPYESIEETGILKEFTPDGIVCSNGGLIFYKNNVIYKNIFPSSDIENLWKFCKKHNIEFQYGTTKNRYFSIPANKYVKNYLSTYKELCSKVKEYEYEEITSVLLMCPKRFDRRIKKIIGKDYFFLRFHRYGVDIRYKHNDKGLATKYTIEYHNLNYDNCMSIGDSFNDTLMYKYTKYSIAMGNANNDVKSKAYFVTKSVKEHGVKYALEHFKII